MERHTYEDFKTAVMEGLKDEDNRLTWSDSRRKTGLDQKRPFNKWVRALERDIGLIRERRRGHVLWRLPT